MPFGEGTSYRKFSRKYKKVKKFHKKKPKPKALVDKVLDTQVSIRNVWNAISNIKNMINCEVKKNDQNLYSATTLTSTLAPVLAVRLPQGTDLTQRDGDSVMLKYLVLDGYIRNATTTPVASCFVRLALILDTQMASDEATLTVSDIFQYADYRVTNSPLNSSTVGRYSILWDKRYKMDTLTRPQIMVKEYIPIKRHHVRYNGTAYTDVQKGALYLLMVCDNTNVSFNNPVGDISCRTAFYDN